MKHLRKKPLTRKEKNTMATKTSKKMTPHQKAWATRKAAAAKRSNAARKAWKTRRANNS